MKKLFSLLTLLLLLCTSAWAADVEVTFYPREMINGGKTKDGVTIYATRNFSKDYQQVYSTGSAVKDSVLKMDKSANANQDTSYISVSSTKVIKQIRIKGVTNTTKDKEYPLIGWSSSKKSQDKAFQYKEKVTLPKNSNASLPNEVTAALDEDDAVKEARLYRVIKTAENKDYEFGSQNTYGDGQTGCILYITVVVAPSGPTINTQPQSASYTTGQTIAALSVDATASDDGDLSYQWYSCDDANKTNAASIGGATTASYTPTTAGFYYVDVIDGNGTTTSNVATITVSAAAPPTISVSGAPANAIVTGTAVTMTAEVTGNPAPTIQWYSNTTASNTNGTIIAGATELTYSPSTTTPDTYYFYAVATNTTTQENNVASAVQTIVVKDKVATPTFIPNGKHFDGTSQSVTIACTTADATIQYSTNGGTTWTDYTAPFDVNATTTVMAKATKSGCFDSDEASATFTKITLTPQANVSAATTWDWAVVTNSEKVEFSSGTELNNADVTYVNISKYGFTAVEGLAAQSALLMNGQRAYNNANGSKHCQVNYLKFNTTVPGTVTVEYANTGNNNPRTVKVNNTKGSKSSSANDSYQSETIAVAAGMVTIAGVQVSDNAASMLRIRKVVFAPVSSVSKEITAAGWATYCSPYALDFSSTITNLEAAYIVTGASGDVVSLVKVNGTVPAETGLLLKGNGTCTIPTAANGEFDVTDNKLVGKTAAYSLPKGEGYVLLNGASGIGFYMNPDAAFTVGANTAYLPANFDEVTEAPSAFRLVDEENNATDIENVVANEKAIKFIENGRILILRDGITYDALGRKVR